MSETRQAIIGDFQLRALQTGQYYISEAARDSGVEARTLVLDLESTNRGLRITTELDTVDLPRGAALNSNAYSLDLIQISDPEARNRRFIDMRLQGTLPEELLTEYKRRLTVSVKREHEDKIARIKALIAAHGPVVDAEYTSNRFGWITGKPADSDIRGVILIFADGTNVPVTVEDNNPDGTSAVLKVGPVEI